MEYRTKELEKGCGRGGEGMEYRTKDLEKGRGGEGYRTKERGTGVTPALNSHHEMHKISNWAFSTIRIFHK